MPIVAKRNSIGAPTIPTRNLDATIILNHAKRIMHKAERVGKPVLRAILYLLLI